MTAPEAKSYSLNNILGGGLLLLGGVLCTARLVATVQHANFFYGSNGSEALGLLPASGLAIARLWQDLTLDPASAISALLYFLLSCWPVAIIFLGAIFLRKSLFATLPPHASLDSHVDDRQGARQ